LLVEAAGVHGSGGFVGEVDVAGYGYDLEYFVLVGCDFDFELYVFTQCDEAHLLVIFDYRLHDYRVGG
jgi:hypothetical protein